MHDVTIATEIGTLPMKFFLGTHEPSWLRTAGVPLFVSARRLRRLKKAPRAACEWALDSGGFTELSMHGRWMLPAREYAAEVDRWSDEVGRMAWAAPQDWMCEPKIRTKTGLSVAEHQARTVGSVVELRGLVRSAHVIPVVQGWELRDYVRCVRLYEDAGIDLLAEPVVGVGTVCRRQSVAEGQEIISTLADLGLQLHGFGLKTLGLQAVGGCLASADSLAWSYTAWRQKIRLPGCTHETCANCMRWALDWRAGVVDRPMGRPAQLGLWPVAS